MEKRDEEKSGGEKRDEEERSGVEKRDRNWDGEWKKDARERKRDGKEIRGMEKIRMRKEI